MSHAGHRSPRIRPFLDLCTSHLSAPARDALDTFEGVLAYPTGHGWLMYAPESAVERAAAFGWPAELLAIVKLAHAHDCAYVLFDADADETDELPLFDE
ncbi:hypothetical protein ACFVGY_31525 [Streptomyces sp. NPDC127106]|uniref:DUF5983 family protein n=1 Tax=Streptomyces sp. NPDC127106 TaxID=3345360 RepID=UPI003636715A